MKSGCSYRLKGLLIQRGRVIKELTALQTLYSKSGRRIPKSRMGDCVWPYLYVWEVLVKPEAYDDSSFRNTELTFQDIENDSELKNKLPDGFYRWACFNFRENLRDFIEDLEAKENWWKITSARAEGQKLAEIGKWTGLTSERVRQICNLLIRRTSQKGGKELLGKLAALRGRTDCVSHEILEEELGRKSTILIYLLTNMLENDADWFYWEDAQAVVLEGGKKVAEEVEAYGKNLPSVIPARDLPDILKKAAADGHSAMLVEEYIKHTMKFDGHNYHSGSIQTQEVCEDIMQTCFQDGIYIYDHNALEKFRAKAREKYGPKAPVPDNDHAMTVLLNRISMLRDRGIYIPARKGVLPEELVERIRAYMEEHGQVSYMYNTIFGVFRDDLLAAGVDNRYYLQGVLRQDLGDGYVLTRDYITTNQEDKQLKDPVIRYIQEADHMVTKEELAEAFHTSPYLAYNCALMDRHIINYFGQYMHIDNLGITDEERDNLYQELTLILSDGEMHETKELLKVIRRKYPLLVQKAHLDAPYPLFSLLNSLFADEFVLNRPYMALQGSKGEKKILELKGVPGTRTKAHTSMPKYRETAGPEQILQTIEEAGLKGITVHELHRKYHTTKQYILNVCEAEDIILIGERALSVKALTGFEEAKEVFWKTIDNELRQNRVIRRNRVCDLLTEALPEFFKTNAFEEYDAPFFLTKYIFQKLHYRDVDWYFHPHNRSISLDEENADVTLMGQVTAYCRDVNRPVTMDEIVKRLSALGFNTDNLKYNLHLCEDPFVFIYGPNTYVLAESLGLSDECMEQVKKALAAVFETMGDLVPYSKIEDTWLNENLPALPMGVAWNKYLLQQLCLFYSDRLGAKTIRPIGMYDFNRIHAFILPSDSPVSDVGDAVWHYMKQKGMTGRTYSCDELIGFLRSEKVISEGENNHAHKLSRFLVNPECYVWNASGSKVNVLK